MIRNFLRRATDAAVGLFYPPHCAGCGADTAAGAHVCAACLAKARRIEAPFCQVCSEPFEGAIDGTFTCSNCTGRKLHFSCAVAPMLSRGLVRDFIHRFKYDRDYFLRHPLAEWAAEGFQDERLTGQTFDALVPVPLHPARRREREFNQADALAGLLAIHARVPVLRALERIRYTTTQTRLDRQERMENLRGAFRVRHRVRVQTRHLLIVDDVFTTGSTVDECARVLLQAGAASVRALTVARG